MISKLNKINFPKKEFDNGRIIININDINNFEVLMVKINEIIDAVNNHMKINEIISSCGTTK